ncbi:CaiB/BaiF CoA-transferase family protein [Brevibacillus centrosporus]|uniref:CaiB/BaiF CoA transferase family protein n=1 Tax=Brevibacillus centrosporus TaxID=54910 RepID=UPI002E1E0A7F|nr:CaiB/BaiF CoA-transferase family protein [Brevibacillus centrosporus]
MLSDILVIDFSQHLPGPYATLRLADRGAQIVKVETPRGDPARHSVLKDGTDRYMFQANGRSKKSMVLDLKEASQRSVALDLIRQADVVIESFRPGVTKRLGISYEDAQIVNPGVVYCSLTGYGQNGPMHQLGSHDMNFMALSGALAQLTDEEGVPIPPSMTFADMAGGMAASEAILAALIQRGKTGKGAYLDIAIADVVLSLMTTHVTVGSGSGEQHGLAKLSRGYVCYGIYRTKDNRYVALGALESKFWDNFCLAVERKQWLSAHMSLQREDNPIFQEMKQLFASRTIAEWTTFSLTIDCCLTPILEIGELHQHPQIQARGLIQEKWGHRYVGTCYLEQKSVLDKATPAPALGEHTEEWLVRLARRP